MLPDPRQRPLLGIAETAGLLGEGEAVIRSAITAGQLPSVRVGRYLRVPCAALWRLAGLEVPGGESESLR